MPCLLAAPACLKPSQLSLPQCFRCQTTSAGSEPKVAVVTGSSRGIGKAIALALGAKGHRVRDAG